MPLLAPVVVDAPVEPPPDPPPPVRPPAPPQDAPYITWTPTGGVERLMACGGEARILAGIIGLDLPPDSQFESPLTLGDGSILIGRRRLPRELIFPVSIKSTDLIHFEQMRRGFMRDFDPARDGVFRWALPDGTYRDLRCRLSEMAPEHGHDGAAIIYYGRWRVTLRAVDPYWYGEPVELSWSAPGGENFYGGDTGGAPPYVISQSNTFGEQSIFIDGEVEVYPEWRLTGPMTTATLSHPTQGSLDLTPNLALGQTLTIRTDRRVVASQKFTREDGSNVWGQVAGNRPVLWPLQPGEQTITVFAAGAAQGQSHIGLTYRPRYLTA